MIVTSTPILPVRNVPAAQDWLEAVLGATGRWTWGTPATYGGVRLGASDVHVSEEPNAVAGTMGVSLMVFVEEIAAKYEVARASGATMERELATMPWGLHEFCVVDPHGHRFRVAEATIPARRTLPSPVQIVARTPSRDEYQRLYRSVGWKEPATAAEWDRKRTRIQHCVMAESGGEAVGMAAISGDVMSYAGVHDVIVRPEFQGAGVGSRLMAALMAWADAHMTVGAVLMLQTGGTVPQFYRRHGFHDARTGLVSMYRSY
ncbi:MAG: GNAT family N-acetyltransferase [Fimbriimonadaceae bacterium]|nr:GNAT family N-acetyltransferase [Fimbriimonadaceae bacterium]